MKYFLIPHDVTIAAISKDGAPLVCSFAQYHREQVWPSEVWRSGSKDAAEHFASCYAKIANAKPGDLIEMTDPEYEIYAPIATMRGQKISPQLAVEFNELMRPILLASAKKPEKVAEPKADDAPAN